MKIDRASSTINLVEILKIKVCSHACVCVCVHAHAHGYVPACPVVMMVLLAAWGGRVKCMLHLSGAAGSVWWWGKVYPLPQWQQCEEL